MPCYRGCVMANRTQGPWEVRFYKDGRASLLASVKSDSAIVIADMVMSGHVKLDSDFIVESCNSHDSLSADNARLREELEHLISIFGCQNAVDPGDDLSGDCKACSVCIARSALAKGGV